MSAQPQRIPARPKTRAQLRRIYGLAKDCGLDNEELHALVFDATNKSSIAALNVTQADVVIARLGGEPLAARRTIQQRRKNAGIVAVVSPAQIQLIADLASQRHWSAETLQEFCRRQTGHFPLRTTKDANKVIEALKSMNRREGLWAA
jgi:Protein of unknown function (DUF1018)